jgi:peptidoglycan/LPS O-acetylase OafA/YrhL
MAAEASGPAAGKERDAAIDWMRALSILYIAGFWHLHNYTSYLPWYRAAPFARVTVTALALFVLISGLLAGQAGQAVTMRSVMAYYRRRLIRIYPPYLLALVAFTVLGLSDTAFLPSAMMLNMIFPPPPFTLWFMTMIVLFYFTAPFLLAIAGQPAKLLGWTSATWLLLFLLDRLGLDVEDRLLIYLPAFIAGILIANGTVPKRLLLVGSAMVGVAGYGLSLRAPALDPDQSLWMVPWATASAVCTFVFLRGRLPHSRIIEELSLGGFFLYLFHRPIYVVLLRISGAESPGARELLLVALGLPLAIVFGVLGQRTYDAAIARLLVARPGRPSPGHT